MRKRDIEEIEKYAFEHGVAFQALKDLYELCTKIHNSGWIDGSNDYIDWGEEDE